MAQALGSRRQSGHVDARDTSAERRRRRRFATLAALLAPTTLLLVLAFVLPIAVLFAYSAYRFDGSRVDYIVTFDAYQRFFSDPFYWDVVGRSLLLAALVTLLAVVIGYPTAYGITRIRQPSITVLLYILIFSPLLTSVVIRAFGWVVLLGDSGFINYVLVGLRLIERPIRLIYNVEGVTIALVHVLLPFAVFPMISVLHQIDPTLKEASNDLGANRWQTFWRVTWPLSLPGVLAGGQTTFVLAVSAFATPSILGGGRVLVLPRAIYEGIVSRDWPLAAVMGVVLLAMTLLLVFISNQLFRVIYSAPQEQEA
jgi:putative spermidine/putrescine transport system permease protein